ncbi:hypothetical protein B0H17DRAFT_1054200 [Mycena rosella]|uniref:Uncharacterized protein n=1 Tax=Mycena rosella TaxID=1033263 RepID=A0AAD7DPT4_MYCRO|nr:hypothetical protein B0H17DRAFT_1054200 [Mycena rosella]
MRALDPEHHPLYRSRPAAVPAAHVSAVPLAGVRDMMDGVPLVLLTPPDSRCAPSIPSTASFTDAAPAAVPAAAVSAVALADAQSMMSDAPLVLLISPDPYRRSRRPPYPPVAPADMRGVVGSILAVLPTPPTAAMPVRCLIYRPAYPGGSRPIAGTMLAGARGMVESIPLVLSTPPDTCYTAPSPCAALYRPRFSCSPAAPIAAVGLARARDVMGDASSVLFMLLAYHFVHSLHLFFVHLAHTCFWFFRLRNMYLG